VINVSDQLTIGASVVFNFKVLLPCVAPKPLPVICTWAPIGPALGETAEISGFGEVNMNSRLLCRPFTVTLTGLIPATVPAEATICVFDQLTTVIAVPFNATLLEPFVAWNPEPLIVICVPTIPLVGLMLVICGGGTVKFMFALLVTPDSTMLMAPLIAVLGTVAVIWVSDQLTMLAVALE